MPHHNNPQPSPQTQTQPPESPADRRNRLIDKAKLSASEIESVVSGTKIRGAKALPRERDALARALFERGDSYDDNPHAFANWWSALPPNLQDEIDAAIAPYPTLAELHWAHTEQQVPVALNVPSPVGRIMARDLPQTVPELFDEDLREKLMTAPASERRRVLDGLARFLGLEKRPSNRPVENADRDGQLSALVDRERISGRVKRGGYEKVCQTWVAAHPEDSDLKPAALREAVIRLRERERPARKADLWNRRLYTYVTNFPKVPMLTCRTCNGSGRVKNPRWNRYFRWHRQPDFELHGEGEKARLRKTSRALVPPTTSGAAELPCAQCNGTGRTRPPGPAVSRNAVRVQVAASPVPTRLM